MEIFTFINAFTFVTVFTMLENYFHDATTALLLPIYSSFYFFTQ